MFHRERLEGVAQRFGEAGPVVLPRLKTRTPWIDGDAGGFAEIDFWRKLRKPGTDWKRISALLGERGRLRKKQKQK